MLHSSQRDILAAATAAAAAAAAAACFCWVWKNSIWKKRKKIVLGIDFALTLYHLDKASLSKLEKKILTSQETDLLLHCFGLNQTSKYVNDFNITKELNTNPVKQEVRCTVILPSLQSKWVFSDRANRTCLAFKNCNWASNSFCLAEWGSGVCRLSEGDRAAFDGDCILMSCDESSSPWPDVEPSDLVPGDFLKSRGVVVVTFVSCVVDFRDAVFIENEAGTLFGVTQRSGMRCGADDAGGNPGKASTGAPNGTNIL